MSSGTASDNLKSIGAAAMDLGAYTNGVEVTDAQLDQISKGKTTSIEVIKLIGHPVRKDTMNGKELWIYPFTKIRHFGSNVNETTTIEFNSKGIVVDAYKAGGRSDSTGNPLVDAANGNS